MNVLPVSLRPHRPLMGGVGLAVGEVGPDPVAVRVASPLACLCAHFGGHGC